MCTVSSFLSSVLLQVACESATKTNMVMIFGEITTSAKVDYEKVVRDTVRNIGFTSDDVGIDADKMNVLVHIEEQSPDIGQGVHGMGTKTLEETGTSPLLLEQHIYARWESAGLCKFLWLSRCQHDVSFVSLLGSLTLGLGIDWCSASGAGDQGHMFGYATDETPELMPLTHMLATQIGYKLTEVRKNGTVGWLRPDGKTQVTVEYKKVNGAMVPQRVHTILISTQHSPGESDTALLASIWPQKVQSLALCWHLGVSALAACSLLSWIGHSNLSIL